MVFFKRAKKVEGKSDPNRLEIGLRVLKTEEGFYSVCQMQTREDILTAETREKAETAKERLETLINWNRPEDVYLMILQGDTDYEIFQEMNRIIDHYDMENEDGEMMEWFIYDESEGGIRYIVEDDDEYRYEVTGELIGEGLAIHEEEQGIWTIDHIPTAIMMTQVSGYEKAKKIATHISELVRWGEKEIIDLFFEVEELQKYLADVKNAVMADHLIPPIPEKLLYKLEFYSIRNERTDWKRFNKAIERLLSMTGLDIFKKEVSNMVYEIKGKEKNHDKIKHSKSNLHMTFTGPAGTGKTEMARIMSEIFASLGYLEKGHLVEVDRSQLVGEHIGHTAPLVKKAVEEAMGGTLFIDEAYSLAGDDQDFGNEAIAALIKEMEDKKGSFMVILAGYQAEMNTLLDSNEGFRSRIKNHFHFTDYTPGQVALIVQNILENKGYIILDDVRKEIDMVINRISKQGKIEGNARKARNIAEEIEEELNIRIGKDREMKIKDTRIITVEDVKLATGNSSKNKDLAELESIKVAAIQKLHSLIGMNELKTQVQRIMNTMVIDKMRYENGISSAKTRMHMIFSGPPGTGKTTVARIIGEFLKGAGILSSGHFIEATRSDLVAGYVGQTAINTKKVIAKAMGGVLFIDEAYSLASTSNNDFGKEALDTLIKEMEDHGEDLVVILAGYGDDMEGLMKLNEGLRSRVPYHFAFPHYSSDELYEMALLQLEKIGLIPNMKARKSIGIYISETVKENGGYAEGDGRWIRNLAESIKENQADRLAKKGMDITLNELREITEEDLPCKEGRGV